VTGVAHHFIQCLGLVGLASAPLPLAAWIAAKSDSRDAPQLLGHQWLVLLLVCCGAHVFVGVALGAVGWLRAGTVYAGEAFLALVGFYLWLRHGGERVRLLPAQRPTSAQVGSLLVFWIVGFVSAWRVLQMPTDNYDSFAYHLPAMAWWYQESAFRLLPEMLHAAYYSFGWEILCVLTLYPLHEDMFIALPNVFIWSGWGLATYLLARRAGAKSGSAMMAVILLLSMPNVLTRLDAAQPDVALAAFFTAALYFGHVALCGGGAFNLGLALFCLLLMPGLKMSGIVYAPVALAGLLLPELWRRFRQSRDWRASLPSLPWQPRTLVPFLIVGLFVGSYWYLRNWSLVGNPFGFLGIEFFGRELLRGEMTRAEVHRTTLAAIFEPFNREHWSILLQVARDHLGWGSFVLALGALAAIWRRGPLSASLWLLLLLCLWSYWTAPYSGDNGNRGYQLTPWISVGLRYGYPFFTILAVLAARGFSNLRLDGKKALVIPVVVSAYVIMWHAHLSGTAIRYAVGVGLPLAISLLRRQELPRWLKHPAMTVLALVILVGVLGRASYKIRDERETLRVSRYGVIHAYMEQNVPADAKIAYIRTHRRYPLFGRSLSREVVSILPQGEDPDAWIRALRDAGVGYVAVGTAEDTESDRAGVADVRPWVESRADAFENMFPAQNSKKDVALYVLKRQ
jgi:hypothetical protein